MPIRGVYNKEEEEFLSKMRAFKLESEWVPEYMPGIPWPQYTKVATRELISIHTRAMDDPNPLFLDEEYAKKTKWGTIIAPPFFAFAISQGGSGVFEIMKACPPSLGTPTANNAGSSWDFYYPIRMNDTFRLRETPEQTITDITREDGTGPRQFLWSRDKLFINQRDEVAAVCHRRIYWFIVPPGEDQRPTISTHPPLTEYIYTKEELDAGDRTWEEEEVRGATPRYWEDVKIGDELKPIVNGPITLYSQVLQFAGELVLAPDRWYRKVAPEMYLEDPLTHLPHGLGDYHLDDRIAQQIGVSTAFTEGTRADFYTGKLLSHWYGNDGFLRRYDSQHRNFCPLGDTVWHWGKVVRKYVEEGQPMVDVACYAESIRGWINTQATAGIILPSRGALDPSFSETIELPDLQVGDKVRVKDRPDWPIDYRFTGSEGTVYQLKHPVGIVGIHLEKTAKSDQVMDTLKPNTSLLFQVENVEKI